jgi:hypothetical protein
MKDRILLFSTLGLYALFLLAGVFGYLELFIVKIMVVSYMTAFALAIILKLLQDYKQQTKAAE